MAIIQALLVKVGAETFAMPLVNVDGIALLDQSLIKTIDNYEILMLRNELIRLIRLSKFFDIKRDNETEGDLYAVIVKLGEKSFGFVINSLVAQQEIVVKPLSEILKSIKYFSGATILGGGQVVLIIDVDSIKRELMYE